MEGVDPYGNYEWLASKRRKIEKKSDGAEETKFINTGLKAHSSKFKQVIKSATDKRNYRVFTLENKIKVVVISDPNTEKAAVALACQAGSMVDPKEYPGIAHLCEKMLFAGNEALDNCDEGSFQDFLDEYDGEYSSYTQRDLAVHMFDVNPTALHAALDRFSRYFICPTFPVAFMEQEIDVIQAESERRAHNEEERCALVSALLTNTEHPFSQFDCGNKLTLWTKPLETGAGEDLRTELGKFWSRHYSANLISLAVLGHESCEQLHLMVEDLFQHVSNKQRPVPRWDSPYGPDQLMTKIEIVPLDPNTRKLFLIFPITDYSKQYKTGTIPYVRYVLGHEGPGSLMSTLKREELVSKLVVDYEQPGPGFAFLTLELQLTSRGQENVDTIITYFFQYIKMVRKEGPQRRLWEELKATSETKFRYLPQESPMNYVENLVTLMPIVPLDEILSCRYLLSDFKPELIKALLDLIVPSRMRIITLLPNNVQVADEVDDWFSCKYKYSSIDDALIKKWSNCPQNSEFKPPPPNPFVATSFNLKPKDTKNESNLPRVLEENELYQLWFLQDSLFREPKATIILHIVSHLPKQSPSLFNLNRLMGKVLEDALTEFSSAAAASGLNYNVEASMRGFTITIHGYDHKIQILFNYILNRLFHFVSYGNVGYRFESLKQQYIEELELKLQQDMYVHATALVEEVLSYDSWSVDELLAAMRTDAIPPVRLVTFAQKFFSQVKVQWFFHGNLTEREALNMARGSMTYFQCVNSQPLPHDPDVTLQSKDVILSLGCTIYEAQKRPKAGVPEENATAVILQKERASVKDKILMELVETILSDHDPEFDLLDGDGKVVWTETRRSIDSAALVVVVQAPKSPTEIERMIDSFLTAMEESIAKLTSEEFESCKIDLAMKKTNQLGTFWDRGVGVFQEIFKQTFNFDSFHIDIREIQRASQGELTKFYRDWVLPSSEKRRKLTIKVTSGDGDREEKSQEPLKPPVVPKPSATEDVKVNKQGNLYYSLNSNSSGSVCSKKGSSTLKRTQRSSVSGFEVTPKPQMENEAGPLKNEEKIGDTAILQITTEKPRKIEPKPQQPTAIISRALVLDENENEREETTPSPCSSNDTFKKYYTQIETEIGALTTLKQLLFSEIDTNSWAPTTQPDTKGKAQENTGIPPEGVGAEAEDESKPKENIEFERHLMDHPTPHREVNVYALTSIKPYQKIQVLLQNKNGIKNITAAGGLPSKGMDKVIKFQQNLIPNNGQSPRLSIQQQKQKQQQRSSVTRPTMGNPKMPVKETRNKPLDPRQRSVSPYKQSVVNEKPAVALDYLYAPRKSMDRETPSEIEDRSRKKQSSKGQEQPRYSSASEGDENLETTISMEKTVAQVNNVDDILEVNFNIDNEILRLKKLRKLLDAKAKRILKKEKESSAHMEQQQKAASDKSATPPQQKPSSQQNGSVSPRSASKEKDRSDLSQPSDHDDKPLLNYLSQTGPQPRPKFLDSVFQEIKSKYSRDDYIQLLKVSEKKLRAILKSNTRADKRHSSSENESKLSQSKRQELLQWLQNVDLQNEKKNNQQQQSMKNVQKDGHANTADRVDPRTFVSFPISTFTDEGQARIHKRKEPVLTNNAAEFSQGVGGTAKRPETKPRPKSLVRKPASLASSNLRKLAAAKSIKGPKPNQIPNSTINKGSSQAQQSGKPDNGTSNKGTTALPENNSPDKGQAQQEDGSSAPDPYALKPIKTAENYGSTEFLLEPTTAQDDEKVSNEAEPASNPISEESQRKRKSSSTSSLNSQTSNSSSLNQITRKSSLTYFEFPPQASLTKSINRTRELGNVSIMARARLRADSKTCSETKSCRRGGPMNKRLDLKSMIKASPLSLFKKPSLTPKNKPPQKEKTQLSQGNKKQEAQGELVVQCCKIPTLNFNAQENPYKTLRQAKAHTWGSILSPKKCDSSSSEELEELDGKLKSAYRCKGQVSALSTTKKTAANNAQGNNPNGNGNYGIDIIADREDVMEDISFLDLYDNSYARFAPKPNVISDLKKWRKSLKMSPPPQIDE